MSKPKGTYSGAVLRAAAAERFAALDPAAQARSHEASFLRHMSQAKDDFDWILANEAWAQLGFSTFADWWDERVAPLAASLGMRPTREIAKTVIEKVVEDQKDLPKAQQRSQREIAAMVGVDRSTVSRSAPGANARGGDLGEAATDPVDAMHAALEDIDAHLAGQAGRSTEDPTDEESDPVVPVASSSALPEDSGTAPGSAPAEQEEPRDGSPPAGEPERAGAGVTLPAPGLVPAQSFMADPVVVLATAAEVYGGLDIEIAGPKLSNADMDHIEASAKVIADVVKLLRLWQSRPAEEDRAA